MHSIGKYRGKRFVRTQRSAQFRVMLMSLAGVLIIGGVGLSIGVFDAQLEKRQILLDTSMMAVQVDANKSNLADELAKADALADEIGDRVADPRTVQNLGLLRTQARTFIATEIRVGDELADTGTVAVDHDVAVGIVALDAVMVNNLRAGVDLVAASHQDFLTLAAAQADAADAANDLVPPLMYAQSVLNDTTGIVDDAFRVPLANAINEANTAREHALNPELGSPEAYYAATEACHHLRGALPPAIQDVINNIPVPEPEEEVSEGE